MLSKLKERMKELDLLKETGIKPILENNLVTEDIAKFRLDICQQCEHLYSPTANCKLCGCFMKVKTKLKKQSCPIKKWTAIVDNKN